MPASGVAASETSETHQGNASEPCTPPRVSVDSSMARPVERGEKASTPTQVARVEYENVTDPLTGRSVKRRIVSYYNMPSSAGDQPRINLNKLNPLSHVSKLGQKGWPGAVLHLLFKLVPCARWMAVYNYKDYLQDDLIAGATVGVMIIPQSMAYAQIAGLPTYYGLYASVLPLYLYAIFGTSRQLAVGPVALVSLLVEAGLSGMGLDNVQDAALWARYAITLAFLSGAFQIFLGVFRLGFVVNFLSHSVISGFTSGAAITIGLSQLPHMLGYKVAKSHYIHETLHSLLSKIDQFRWSTFLMGMIWLAFLMTFKYLGKNYPKLKPLRALGPLLVVLVSTVLMAQTRWNEEPAEIKVVGFIDEGFPPTFNDFAFDNFFGLLSSAIVISFVGFMESIAISKRIAARHKYEIDADQELIGLGLANMLGSCFTSYPVTGSFSRSAVNDDTGAKSGVAAMVTASMVVCVLLFITEGLYFLPQNALAAIVLNSVFGLFDYEEFKFLWKVSKKDCLLWVVSFLGTLFLGIELGIAIAVAISLAFVIYESARPHMAELGQLPGTSVYRNIEQYSEAKTVDGMIILRIDAPIYFANVDYVKDKLRHYELLSDKRLETDQTMAYGDLETLAAQTKRLRFVILEMSPVSSIDSTGIHALTTIVEEYKARDIHLALANPNRAVMEQLERADLPNRIGREFLFLRVHDAVEACVHTMQEEALAKVDA